MNNCEYCEKLEGLDEENDDIIELSELDNGDWCCQFCYDGLADAEDEYNTMSGLRYWSL